MFSCPYITDDSTDERLSEKTNLLAGRQSDTLRILHFNDNHMSIHTIHTLHPTEKEKYLNDRKSERFYTT